MIKIENVVRTTWKSRTSAIWLAYCALLCFFSLPTAGLADEEKSSLSEYWLEDGKHYNLACEHGSKFEKVSEDVLSLNNGTFLVESEGDISLKTGTSTIEMKPKSMALVRVFPGTEHVYCLLLSVNIETNHRSFGLNAGDEGIVLDHVPDPAELTGENDVGVRRQTVTDVSDKCRIATAEFSILQAAEKEPLLSQIIHSNHSHDRLLKEKILKSAAVLRYVTDQHGPYMQNSKIFERKMRRELQ